MNRIMLLLSAFLVLGIFQTAARAEDPYPISWLIQNGSAEDDVATGVAADNSGNVFLTGWTRGVLEEGKTLGGGLDIFVAKYESATGKRLWIKQLSSPTIDLSAAVAVDAGNNVFVTGSVYTGTGDTQDVLVIKLNGSTGETVWVKQLGTTPANDVPAGLAVDAGGNVFVAGTTDNALAPGTFYAVFLAKLSGATGDLLWSRQYGPGFDNGAGIAIDGTGNLFLCGTTQGALENGKPNAGMTDVFLAKLTATGDILWVRQFGSAAQDGCKGVTTNASGRAIITGGTYGALEEGAANAGSEDIFVASYSPTGDRLWLKQFGSAELDEPSGVASDSGGNVFISGRTSGSLQEGVVPPSYWTDFFLAKFSSTGEKLWVRQVGGPELDEATGVAVDGNGSVYETGFTRSALQQGAANAGETDYFLAKFAPPKEPKTAVELIAQVIADFDKGVANGTITGSGPGNSDEARKGALATIRKMLVAVQLKITGGNNIPACNNLAEIYRKMDGGSAPPDMVSGPGLAVVRADMVTLSKTMGCR